jgi:hypothetical protein
MRDIAQTNLQLYGQLTDLRWEERDLDRVVLAYDLAMRLFSGRYRCSGKPFVAHLVGTASVMAELDCRPQLVVAALLHAAYDQGDFGIGRRATPSAQRRMLASAIGAEAELLVYAYTLAMWNERALVETPAMLSDLTPQQRDVLLIRLSNEIDDHVDLGSTVCNRTGSTLHPEESIQRLAIIADGLGYPELARRFVSIAEEERNSFVPKVFHRPDSGSKTIAPSSYRPRMSASLRTAMKNARSLAASVPTARRAYRWARRHMRAASSRLRGG